MEKKLSEAYDFLDNTIQSSPNAIMCTDMNGDIIMWNKGAEDTLGYKASDVIGKMNVVGNLYTRSMAKKVMKMMRSDQYGGKGKLRSCPMTFKRNDDREVEGTFPPVSSMTIRETRWHPLAFLWISVKCWK